MKLALFFTTGVSLKTWEKVGSLAREIKPYQELAKYFDEIYFLTYGKDEPVLASLKGCEIRVLPASIFRKELKNIDIFKTNQINGSWKAVLAKKIFKKKLVIRQGYQWSIFAQKEKNKKWKLLLIQLAERLAYKNADAIIVTSKEDKKYIQEKYNISSQKINYIPNYIDTDLFKPLNIPKENRICFVGRLEKQKNLFNLIKAVSNLGAKLIIFGNGSLEDKLRSLAPSNVEFKGNIPNRSLALELNKCRLFILPSFYEGCPKVLLEAMACGLPVIGADVYGIKEIIKHKESGYLCKTDAVSIRKAILEVLSDRELQEKMGKNARKTIVENFSLEKIITREIKVYDKILAS